MSDGYDDGDVRPAAGGQPEPVPNRAVQLRHLLPRWPSDRVVAGLIGVGLAAFVISGSSEDSSLWWLLPGAVAATIQHVNGHWAAWHSEGVERAYVLESSALCFYALTVVFLLGGILQGVGVIGHVNLGYVALVAMVLDTVVRDVVKNRYA
jgi:hypothetical protein